MEPIQQQRPNEKDRGRIQTKAARAQRTVEGKFYLYKGAQMRFTL